MNSVVEKIIVITGAASGYGKAMAAKFLKEEATVIVADYDQEMLKSATKEMDGLDGYELDVTSYEQWEKFRDYIISTYGKIDILINNAGGAISVKDTISQDKEIIDKIVELNLISVVYGCKVFGSIMKRQKKGTIINISSDCARHAWPNFGIYAAAKSGVINFSKALYVELRPFNVRVTSIIPGAGNTNFSKNAGIPEPDEPYKLGGPELAEAAFHICTLPQCILVEEYMLSGTEREIIPM